MPWKFHKHNLGLWSIVIFHHVKTEGTEIIAFETNTIFPFLNSLFFCLFSYVLALLGFPSFPWTVPLISIILCILST